MDLTSTPRAATKLIRMDKSTVQFVSFHSGIYLCTLSEMGSSKSQRDNLWYNDVHLLEDYNKPQVHLKNDFTFNKGTFKLYLNFN